MVILAGAAIFLWQRSQIAGLRAQVARQGAELVDNRERLADLSLVVAGPGGRRAGIPSFPAARAKLIPTADYSGAVLSADDRRVILNQYRDVLAELDLPTATASRLEDLLTDRIESFLDAQDAAEREGFAEGSAETERSVALAIADDDRAIGALLGGDANRRLSQLLSASPPEPAVMPEPAAPPVAVTVVVQMQAAPSYPDASAQPAVSDDYNPSPYYYYPYTGLYLVRESARPLSHARPGIVRPRRSVSISPARRS